MTVVGTGENYSNRSGVQRFRGLRLYLGSLRPFLEIYEPSTGLHSSLQTTKQAIERTHIPKKVLRQVRISSLLLLLPSTWNPKPGTCERLHVAFQEVI